MDNSILILFVAMSIVAVTARSLLRSILIPTPGGGVLMTSVAYLIGITIVAIRNGNESAYLVFWICAVFITAYLVGYYGAGNWLNLILVMPEKQKPIAITHKPIILMAWIAFLSTAGIVLLVIYLTGTDRILAALYQFVFLGDTNVSVMELRLRFSTGEERYFAPGYVKQFRDVLLPFCALLVMFTVRRSHWRFFLTVAWIVPLVAAMMISSGERGPVLLFLIGTVYSALHSVKMQVNSKRTVLAAILFIVILGGGVFSAITSSFTSREYEDTSTGMILADRIITRAPEENAQGAAIWGQGAPYPGAGWVSDLSSILPGVHQLKLSNILHEDMGGGDKGNSVLGAWVDVFYNFGWMLGIPVSATIGVIVAMFTHWVNIQRMRSPVSSICGIWISVTMLMVLSPYGFLLYGPFVLAGILFLMPRLTSRPLPAEGPSGVAELDV